MGQVLGCFYGATIRREKEDVPRLMAAGRARGKGRRGNGGSVVDFITAFHKWRLGSISIV